MQLASYAAPEPRGGPWPLRLRPASSPGAWRGSFAWPGGTYWTDDGDCMLRVDRDGTFSATVTAARGRTTWRRPRPGPGPVSAGDRVTLRSSQGPSTPLRSGDRLHGVAEDPIVEVPVTISFERERPAA